MKISEISGTIHDAIHRGDIEVIPYEGARARHVRVDEHGRRFVRIPGRSGKTITWVEQDNRTIEKDEGPMLVLTNLGHQITRIYIDRKPTNTGVLNGKFVNLLRESSKALMKQGMDIESAQ